METAPFNTSLTKGSSNTLLALIMVIIIEGISVIFEDIARHKSDAEANSAVAHCFDVVSGTFQNVTWKSLRVGNIIKVESGEKFPADLLLLCAATEKGGGCGQAYVETKSLDGETNLKLRVSSEEMAYLFKSEGTHSGKPGERKWEPNESTLLKLAKDGKCRTVSFCSGVCGLCIVHLLFIYCSFFFFLFIYLVIVFSGVTPFQTNPTNCISNLHIILFLVLSCFLLFSLVLSCSLFFFFSSFFLCFFFSLFLFFFFSFFLFSRLLMIHGILKPVKVYIPLVVPLNCLLPLLLLLAPTKYHCQ